KRLRVNGELRMSLATLLGVSLKAAKGHQLEVIHRDNVFELHRFDKVPTAYFSQERHAGEGQDGVVMIHIGSATRNDLNEALNEHRLSTAPRLYLESASPIPDLATLNTAVAETKHALSVFRSEEKIQTLHLVIKGPAFFAMALGHRLNAVGEVQLYDWIGSSYISSVRFRT
ncbi:MAG TPA: SAVED domain-containing protein, partial [Noviherbaspirillum sp.]|uniref:SAVED domain-containing protein n=1 Tax=Noviherbaspirillum sp. TaxID=1926288 RepID=UPI002D233C77